MLIYDCFTYFNEATALAFRLQYLEESVDRFIIVESFATFTGGRKQCNAQDVVNSLPQSIRRKCKVISLTCWPRDTQGPETHWQREEFQRNGILLGLGDISDSDRIMICDVDEVPDITKIEIMSDLCGVHGGLSLGMDVFYYSALNWMHDEHGKPLIWTAPKMILGSRLRLPHQERMDPQRFPVKTSCGWHFSYMGGSEAIEKKIKAYSHQEYNNPETLGNISSNVAKVLDLFGRKYTFKRYELSNLPSLIIKRRTYRDYFLPEIRSNY